jgi:cellulose synthase/poly-beta-1,6-N-acetylglucosamine synthase-like glycosyltransferase
MLLTNLVDLVSLSLCIGSFPYFAFILLTSLAAIVHGRVAPAGRGSAGPLDPPRRRFLIVIPAHDEEDGIAETVRSCAAIDYPAGLFDVLVIADNCTDRTAERAREAGARVVERSDPTRRSKGYALEFLIERLRETGEFERLDAVVVLDADSTAHPSLLWAFVRSLDAGHEWAQCYDAVGNADVSRRTRLMAYAFSLINGVTLQGQAALGLSAALRGNGMCLSTRGLDRIPWRAHGLTEDLEYSWSVRLAGGRIGFDRGGAVYATMLPRGGAAADQRRRWEGGRRLLRRLMLGPLLRTPHLGPVEKIAALIELTMPTAGSLGVAYLFLSLLVAARSPGMLDRCGPTFLTLMGLGHATATLALALHLVSPFLLSFLPWRFGLSLLYFPYYVCWRALVASRPAPPTWVRTVREPAAMGANAPSVGLLTEVMVADDDVRSPRSDSGILV